MNRFLSILTVVCVISACSPAPSAKSAGAESATAPITGADQAAHGCKASAGYTWSAVRAECIRIFEAGLSFEPYPAPTQGAVLAAFVVLAPAQGHAVTAAEVFVPERGSAIALTVVHTPEGDIRPTLLENKAEGVQVYRHKDDLVLVVKGQTYRRAITPDDRLFKIH